MGGTSWWGSGLLCDFQGPGPLSLWWLPSSIKKILKIIFYGCIGIKTNIIQLDSFLSIHCHSLFFFQLKKKNLNQSIVLGP